MNIDVRWEEKTRCAVMSFGRQWRWDDFYRARAELHALLDAAPGVTPVILDFRRCHRLPPGSISHYAGEHPHPNQGALIYVSSSRIIGVMARILSQALPTDGETIICDSLVMALDVARSQRRSLAPAMAMV